MPAYNHNIKFGEKIRSLRREQDLTQEELASRAKLDDKYISNLEKGMNSPSLDTIAQLARALKVTIADLFSTMN